MPLRLHLRHSLGEDERSFDDRDVAHPLTVGRSVEADLRIPNIHLGPVHCAFFVHGDAWVVQDGGSERGTRLNGEPLAGPRVLAAGDVVTLGPSERDPPSLTVVEATTTAMIADATETASLPAATVATADFYATDPAVTFPVSPHASRRAAASSSSGGLWVVAAVMMLAFLVAAVLILRHKREQSREAATPATVSPSSGVRGGGGSSMFSEGRGGSPAAGSSASGGSPAAGSAVAPSPSTPALPTATRPAPGVPSSSLPAATTDPSAPASMFQDDPRKRDPDWVRVEDAARTGSPGQALAIYADYRSRHPRSPLLADLDRLERETLDRLWWQRLAEMIGRRDRLAARREARREDLRDLRRSGPDRQRLAELESELADLEQELAAAAREIEDEMGHRGQAFDPFDEAAVARLRPQRDGAKFEAWSRHVLAHARRTRGSLPW